MALVFLLLSGPVFADGLLMTLSVESSKLSWQDDFILTLEIYGAPAENAPEVTIDGLDQFELKGIGKNLLQVPRGKTVKWILTYNLTAGQGGEFKLGPATAPANGKLYRSNTLFITVEGPRPQKPAPKPIQKPAQKQAEATPPKPTVTTPLVRSSAEIGNKILILMEASKQKPYRGEGVTVTLRLLSQLPVENLRFQEEAEFPGFLKYDFPFTTQPKAEWRQYEKTKYASYDLQKFLIFPLEDGRLKIPPVRCQLKVRVPSGAFEAADLKLDVDRSSNGLQMQVLPAGDADVVGDFVARTAITQDSPQSKIVRWTLEGEGQLTTFDFPEPEGPHLSAKLLSSNTTASIRGENLRSRKTTEVEITPLNRTTSIILAPLKIRQFDPDSRHYSTLTIPALSLKFTPPGLPPPRPVPVPQLRDHTVEIAFGILFVSAITALVVLFRPKQPKRILRLRRLFHRKNPGLQISRRAAHTLYQQIMEEIAANDGAAVSLIDTLRGHLPQTEWLNFERAFRKLESTAYSQTKTATLTYGELKQICERVERLWQ